MTLAVETPISTATASGATGSFVVGFSFTEDSDLLVTVIAGGVETARTLGVHYTVSGDYEAGGATVVFVPAHWPVEDAVVEIRRATPVEQPAPFGDLAKFMPRYIEKGFDRAFRVLQENKHAIEGGLRGEKGNKGDPGGNVMAVGLFSDIAALTWSGVTPDRIQTSGHTALGVGAASYVLSNGFGGAGPDLTQDADGNWWRLAEPAPSATQLGAPTNGAVDAAGIFNVLTGQPSERLLAGQSFNVNAPAGGFLLDGMVSLPFEKSLIGEGFGTKFLTAASPAISTLFALNTDGAGAWIYPFPGELSSEVGKFYIDARPAAANGNKILGFEFGGSQHFHDIKAGGLQQVIRQVNEYSDLVRIERLGVFDQPTTDGYSVDLKWTGDGVFINQCLFYRMYDDGAEGAVDPSSGRRVRAIRLRFKVGAVVQNIVNGDQLYDTCDALSVRGLHMEDGQVIFRQSSGSLENARFWMRGDSRGDLSCVPLLAEYGSSPSLVPSMLNWRDLGFVYQQTFPGGYSITKNNFELQSSPFAYMGVLRVESIARMIRPNVTTPGLAQKFGVTCGMAEFDDYSHFASVNSIYASSRWNISAALGDLPSSTDVILASDSALSTDRTWTGSSGTYYYKAQLLYDKHRRIGLTGAVEKALSPTNGGNAPTIVLALNARVQCMVRLYRGSSSGSYDHYVDLPILSAARLADTGDDVAGFPWISRTPAGVDALNVLRPISFHLAPGETTLTSPAYGHVEVYGAFSTVKPTVGNWRRGDLVHLATPPTGDGSQRLVGYRRLTDGAGHVLETDWAEMWEYHQALAVSDASFLSAASPVNTVNKSYGKMAFDVTTGVPLWSIGLLPTAPWADATGAVIYTPS